MGRQEAQKQARRGTGVAEIEDVRRLGERAHADAVNGPSAITARRHRCAKRIHGSGGRQYILALEQAGNFGPANRERAQHQSTMRDRFVSRDSNRAGKRPAGSRNGLGRLAARRGDLGHAKMGLGNLESTVASAPRPAHIVRPNGAATPIYLRNFAFDRVTTLWQWRAEDLC